MNDAILGIIKTSRDADNLVAGLKLIGIPDEHISVLFTAKTNACRMMELIDSVAQVKAAEPSFCSIERLEGLSAFTTSNGAFVVSGLLQRIACNSHAGGLVRALTSFGLNDFDARMVEERVREGCYLVAVHCVTGQQLRQADALIKQAHAEDIRNIDAAVKSR